MYGNFALVPWAVAEVIIIVSGVAYSAYVTIKQLQSPEGREVLRRASEVVCEGVRYTARAFEDLLLRPRTSEKNAIKPGSIDMQADGNVKQNNRPKNLPKINPCNEIPPDEIPIPHMMDFTRKMMMREIKKDMKEYNNKRNGKAVKPEAGVTGSKKHGVKWKEGKARAKKDGKPQGQWHQCDLEYATEKANTLNPGESAEFDLPKGSK